MSERTKIHPRYWHREGRALAVLDTRDDLPLAGCIGGPQAIEQSWAHADALIREGYMLAVQNFRDVGYGGIDERELANTVESMAPGEAE